MPKTATKAAQKAAKAIKTQSEKVTKVTKIAKDLTKNLPLVQETIDTTYNAYNQHADSAIKFLSDMALLTDQTTEQIVHTMNTTNDFFKKWFQNQMELAKTWVNTPNNSTKTETNDWTAQFAKWNEQMTNLMQNNPMMNMMNMDWMKNNPMMIMMNMEWMKNNPMMSMMNMEWMKNNPMMNMMNMEWMKSNPMMNMMNMEWMKNNPMMNMMNMTAMQEAMTNASSTWNGYVKQYMDMMNSVYADFTKNMSNLTTADTFKGMFNMVEGMKSFYTMWEPYMTKMQNGEFDVTEFMKNMSSADYKTFVDKFFSFMPENMRQYAQTMQSMFVEQMKRMSEQGMTGYNYLSNMMHNSPMMNMNPFGGMMAMYNMMRDNMMTATSPLTNLLQDNAGVKNVKIWQEIADKLTTFNIKNAELQTMMYKQGLVAMEETAKSVYEKMQNGESFDSIIKVYQQWLMNADKSYISLFESDEYSKLMTEVSSLQMQIKHNIETQMEQMFSQMLPVATRSQLDEIYKAMYDLKKEVRGTTTYATPSTTASTTSAKTTKKTSTVKPVAKKTAKRTTSKKK